MFKSRGRKKTRYFKLLLISIFLLGATPKLWGSGIGAETGRALGETLFPALQAFPVCCLLVAQLLPETGAHPGSVQAFGDIHVDLALGKSACSKILYWTNIYIYVYMYMYIYICVYMCVYIYIHDNPKIMARGEGMRGLR